MFQKSEKEKEEIWAWIEQKSDFSFIFKGLEGQDIQTLVEAMEPV